MTEETFTLRPAGEGPVDENGEKKEYPTIPEGTILDVECLGLEKKTMPFKDDDGNDVVKVEFSFRIVDGEYENRRLWGQTSTVFSTHEDCRLYQWVKALLGVDDLQPNFTFRAAEMKGTRARAEVGTRTYTPRNSTEVKEVNFVGDLMPARSNTAAAPASNGTGTVTTTAAPAPTLASVASAFGAEEVEEPF